MVEFCLHRHWLWCLCQISSMGWIVVKRGCTTHPQAIEQSSWKVTTVEVRQSDRPCRHQFNHQTFSKFNPPNFQLAAPATKLYNWTFCFEQNQKAMLDNCPLTFSSSMSQLSISPKNWQCFKMLQSGFDIFCFINHFACFKGSLFPFLRLENLSFQCGYCKIVQLFKKVASWINEQWIDWVFSKLWPRYDIIESFRPLAPMYLDHIS